MSESFIKTKDDANIFHRDWGKQTRDLKKIDMPTLMKQGDDELIVTMAASAEGSGKLLRTGELKINQDYPHGMLTINADVLNADMLAFIKA